MDGEMYVMEKVFPNHQKEGVMLNNICNTEMVKVLNNRRSQEKEKQPVMPSHQVRTPEDKVSLEENPVEVITYGIPQKSPLMDSDYSTLREMLGKILEEQGIATQIASGDTSIDFRNLTPEKAQELISEDGYLGVKQTSDRIVQFALSISSNDPNRLEEIKASINKGYQMAAKALGGTLPDISTKTYNAVMDKLNAWAEGFDEASSRTGSHEELLV